MSKQKTTRVITNMGFDWGDMAVEACFETDTHQCIRVRSMKTGNFIDVQMSKGGRRLFAYDKKQSKNLKGFDPCNSGKRLI